MGHKFKYDKFKLLSTILLFSILFTGCTLNSKPNSKTLKDGTYETTANGYASTIKLSTTISKGKISKIKVLEHGESPDIGQVAVDILPEDIVKYQSIEVDSITGATSSSNAIKQAVVSAITEAGGNIENFNSPIPKSDDKKLEKTADIIIIGGGGAGLSAAVSAAENNASVILIEKTALIGGNTIRAGGPFNAVDPVNQAKLEPANKPAMQAIKELTKVEPLSELHKKWMEELNSDIEKYESGKHDYLFDSLALHILQTYAGGDYAGKLEFIEKLASDALPTAKWLSQNSVEWSGKISTVPGGLWRRGHIPKNSAGSDYIIANKNKALKLGVELILNCQATELISQDQRVVGVKAKMTNGREVQLNANKAVIIATGGFASNPEMRKQYDPNLLESLKTTNSPAITGDGIKLAQALNTNLIGMEYIQCLPLGDPKTGNLNGWMGGIGVEYYYQVNKAGKRFMAEDGRRDTMTQALLAQEDAMSYVITDTNSESESSDVNLWGDNIEKLVQDGSIFKADSIEELAAKIGIDPIELKNTHEKFNQMVESGIDEEYGRKLFGDKLDKAPFYASPRTPTVHHTMGGIEIDINGRVLDVDGKIIEGLYAAGEVTGGIHGKNRLGGNALVDIHVFGREAGKNAALSQPKNK